MSHRKQHGFHAEKQTENGTSWLLFRQAAGPDDPILFFNNSLDELAGAELFSTQQELNRKLGQSAVLGMPYTLEVNIEKKKLASMIREGEYEAIAKEVKSMNDKKVEFKDGNFAYIGPQPGM